MVDIYACNQKIENVEAVLFDKDGTFIDSDIYWGKLGEMRINEVLRHFNLSNEFFQPLAEVIGLDFFTGRLISNGPLAILSRDEVISILTDELVKNNNINTDTVEIANIFEKVHNQFVEKIFDYTFLIDGAKNLFERLKNLNIKMAVVTSDTYSHTVATLKYLKVDKFFDCVVGCDLLSSPKKTGKPALFAIDKMNVDKRKTIVIGDAPMDAQMAQNAGLKAAILVTTGQVSQNELFKYSPLVVESLSDIEVVK